MNEGENSGGGRLAARVLRRKPVATHRGGSEHRAAGKQSGTRTQMCRLLSTPDLKGRGRQEGRELWPQLPVSNPGLGLLGAGQDTQGEGKEGKKRVRWKNIA